MAGPAQLSYTTIRDWSVLTGSTPTPEEVHALIRLDGVLLEPPPDQKATVARR